MVNKYYKKCSVCTNLQASNGSAHNVVVMTCSNKKLYLLIELCKLRDGELVTRAENSLFISAQISIVLGILKHVLFGDKVFANKSKFKRGILEAYKPAQSHFTKYCIAQIWGKLMLFK